MTCFMPTTKSVYRLRHKPTNHFVGKEERPHHPRLTGTNFAKLETLVDLVTRAKACAPLYGWKMEEYEIVRFAMSEVEVIPVVPVQG